MQLYTALDKNATAIVTVLAKDVRDASARIYEQLWKRGRRAYLDRWIEGNYLIEREESVA